MSHSEVLRAANEATDGSEHDLGLSQLVISLALTGSAIYGFAGLPRIPASLPALPADLDVQLELLVRSPTPAQLDAVAALLAWAFWLGWAFLLGTTLLRIGVVLAERVAAGAAWVRSLRWLSDLLTLPFVSRAVDASLAGTLVLRVALATPDAALASAAPIAAQAQVNGTDGSAGTSPRAAPGSASLPAEVAADLQPGDVVHVVRPGESLWSIARMYFGDPEQWKQVYADNRHRPQPSHGSLQDAGKIYPGWLLVIHHPTELIEFDDDGQAWHTVRHGESLWSIAEDVFGDGSRWPELFDANVGLEYRGYVLSDPNVIQPGMRLRVDGLVAAATAAPETEVQPSPAAQPAGPAADVPTPAPAVPAEAAPAQPTAEVAPPAPAGSDAVREATPVPEPASPTATSVPSPTPTPTPAPEAAAGPRRAVSPEQAAVAAGGLAAVGLAAGRLVVRRQRPAPVPTEPESDVRVEDGFADADPVHDLGRRLAHTPDTATAIAGLLGRAYMAVFDEQLHVQEREEASQGVSVAAARHGRTSTTLVLAAPLAARPHLVRCMRAAAVRAFGARVDVDGLVDQNGDVLVRVTWDPRRPIAGHLLEPVDGGTLPSAWATPCLVPALVLRDRQHLSVNWHGVGNVLVAAPTGQGADVPLTALVAALASARAPEDLGLVVVARPHTLPDEVGLLPHGLGKPVDPGDPRAVEQVLERVQREVDRRRQVGGASDADLVVVVRELGELEPAAQQLLGAIAAAGPEHGVRLLVASERPVAELLGRCPFLDLLGTRLVLQAATEEDSVALLGMPGADRLGAGGHALLRLEGRVPVPGWARRVSADRLARLVDMMGTRGPAAPSPDEAPAAEAAPETDAGPVTGVEPLERAAPEPPAGAAAVATPAADGRPAETWTPSPLLRRLRAAPIRVRCFGAGETWCGDRLLKIGDPELLLLFAVHPLTGIQNEALADMLWETPPPDISAALRKARFNLRTELRRLAPEVAGDPLPGNGYQGEKAVALDTSLVSSDVHEFTELLRCAEKLEPPAAIQAYEAALDLYRGDLLDSPEVVSYRWMYDADPQVALTLRSDFRRRHKEARLRLAQLLADGPDAGLARAEELYVGLCAESPEDEHLWTALFRIHERTGSAMGLESAVRRLRAALVELGTNEAADIDSVPLPPNLERLVQQIRQRIGSGPDQPPTAGD